MQVRFLGQPHGDSGNLRDFFEEVAEAEGLTHLDIAVAWAKDSGLARVAEQISAVRERGSARIILGIDAGGATRQGLDLARELFDVVEVVHRPGAATFHPKLYLARGDAEARVLVGSNNLTAGGTFRNDEAALVVSLDLDLVEDAAVLDEVERYLAALRGDQATCKRLDDELLAALLDDPRYPIADESSPPPPATGTTAPAAAPPTPPLFGPSSASFRTDPGRAVTVDPAGAVASPLAPAGVGSSPGAPPAVPVVVERWTKKLSHSDAQQKRTPRTQVTGNMKLTEAGHPIDHTRYFRHEFFGSLTWTAAPKPKGDLETAAVVVELVANGVVQGRFEMVVDHADYRISDQSNVPTWLKWKQASPYMRTHDHAGHWASLERLSDGTFRLQITPEQNGPFLRRRPGRSDGATR